VSHVIVAQLGIQMSDWCKYEWLKTGSKICTRAAEFPFGICPKVESDFEMDSQHIKHYSAKSFHLSTIEYHQVIDFGRHECVKWKTLNCM